MQNRLKSKYLWLSIFALIGFIVKTWFHVDMATYNELVDLILMVLVGLGIVNNPTDKKNW